MKHIVHRHDRWHRLVASWLAAALVLPAVLTRADVIFEIPDDASLLMTVFQENPEGFQDQFRVGFAYYKMGPAGNPENSGMRAWFNTPDLPWTTGAGLWGG